MTSKPIAYVALTTARDELRSMVSEDMRAFAAALQIIELAIPAAEHEANAEDAFHYCKQAMEILDGIEERHSAAGTRPGKRTEECLEDSRKAIYRAAAALDKFRAENF